MTRSSLQAPQPSSPAQNLARTALGAMLLFTGISHLTFAKRPFRAQVPASVPMRESTVVAVSGVGEIAIGASLILLPRQRIPLGLGTAAFFVAVFPGNVSQYIHGLSAFGLDTDAKRLGRLFVQPLFVAWALYGTGAWNWLRDRSDRQRSPALPMRQ